MATIMTVAVEPRVLAPRDTDKDCFKVTRAAYSIDGYSPVLVTIRVRGRTATISTVMLPDGLNAWWREPSTAQRRVLLDAVLAPMGLRRSASVQDLTADGWHHTYPITAI